MCEPQKGINRVSLETERSLQVKVRINNRKQRESRSFFFLDPLAVDQQATDQDLHDDDQVEKKLVGEHSSV